jgi:hypothetical protein
LKKIPTSTISSCMTDEEFLAQIERFMVRYRISPTTFGLWAMDDSRFVFDLWNGRSCLIRTVNRVRRFMIQHEKKEEAKRQQYLPYSLLDTGGESQHGAAESR